MDTQSKVKIKDSIKTICAILFFWLYIPHFFVYIIDINKCKKVVYEDLKANSKDIRINLPTILQLLFQLHTNRYFRNIFYYRIGPIASLVISWYRPGDYTFSVPFQTKIGPGLTVSHPYATALNADSIGSNFNCKNNTTIGQKSPSERPSIGDNVSVGCNAVVIGKVKVGNNVTIGAGCIVVKDIPDNAIVVGNPARIIKYNEPTKL